MRGIVTRFYKTSLRLVPLLLIMAFISSIIGPNIAMANPGWYNLSWQYRKKITINAANVNATLTDFAVMISVTSDSALGTHAQLDGDDILFTAADEVTKIPHEIEKYSSNGATANLTAWVKVSTLSYVTNTEIYMYYGNAGVGSQQDAVNVWDSNYKMVQHLSETSGTHYDSTQYNNDGMPNITPASNQNATGKVDGADIFDGTDDRVVISDNNSLDTGANITVEAWVKGSSQAYKVFTAHCDSGTNQLSWKFYTAATTKLRIDISDDGTYNVGHRKRYDSSIDVFDNNWHHVVFTFNSTLTIYIDGNADTSPTKVYDDAITSLHNSTADVLIGAFLSSGTPAQFYNGSIDEVRISNTARSADWIKTSYNNQNNPASFLSLGPEQNAPVTPTVTTNSATNVEETTAVLHAVLDNDGGDLCQYSFEWGTAPGVYTANISWTGTITTGSTFNLPLVGLTKGQPYYYRAKVKNSAGIAYGGEVHFLTKPDLPTAFTATVNSSSRIDLSWTKGDGAQRTMIRRSTLAFPATYLDGDQVYFDTGTSFSDTGLSSNTTYYYRAWSEVTSSQQWSNGFSSTAGHTFVAAVPVTIGGKVYSVNKAAILVPWILLGIVSIFIFVRVILYVRKKTLSRPPPEKNLPP